MSSWIAAATSYSTNNRIMLPFYIFYSMFGFQRIGDLAWAAGDMQARGFLLGATSGRTTLNGEGLQHQDGHSHLIRRARSPTASATTRPSRTRSAVILQDGLRRMVERAAERLVLRHAAQRELRPARAAQGPGGGHPARHVPAARRAGRQRQGHVDRARAAAGQRLDPARGHRRRRASWNATTRSPPTSGAPRASPSCARRHRLRALEPAASDWTSRASAYVTRQLERSAGPIVASTDYMRSFADQIRPYVPHGRAYTVLGTDGFGRSDTREALRRFFEVDRHYVVVAALKALADEGAVPPAKVAEAIAPLRHRSGQAQSGHGLSRAGLARAGAGNGAGQEQAAAPAAPRVAGRQRARGSRWETWSRYAFRTSATSRRSRSSRCWSSRATPSRPSSR